MKNIIHVCYCYKPAWFYGGLTGAVTKICETLQPLVQQQVLATTANGAGDLDYTDGQTTETDGVTVTFFKRITGDSSNISISLWRRLFKLAGKQTIVHVHGWWSLPMVGAAFICKLKGIRFILTPHGMLGAYSFSNRTILPKKIFHFTVGRWLLRNAAFHVTAESEKRDIEQLLPTRSNIIFNVANIPNLPAYDIAPRIPSPCLRLVFFSRVEEKKGLDYLLHALNETAVDFSLDIYGEGTPEYIHTLKSIIAPHVQHRIHWKGAVYGDDKFRIMGACDLMVLPSHYENFALVVLESLSAGTPVLITRQVGLVDFVEAFDLGWICTLEKADILEKLDSIAADKDKRQRIEQTASTIVRREFAAEKLSREYVQMYETFSGKYLVK